MSPDVLEAIENDRLFFLCKTKTKHPFLLLIVSCRLKSMSMASGHAVLESHAALEDTKEKPGSAACKSPQLATMPSFTIADKFFICQFILFF